MSRSPLYPLILLFCLLGLVHASLEWDAANFCKCICFGNSTILPLYRPTNPNKPCLSCTKQWCLDQKIAQCANATLGDTNPDTATGKEGDVEARCFQRDSPRDQLIVTLYILLVFGLLLGAGIKRRMEKAGFDANVAWRNGRRWWETWLPTFRQETFSMAGREDRHGAYVPVADGPTGR